VGEHRPGLNNQPWEVDPLLTNGTGARLSPHVLRHTWCTLAIDAGASLMKVQHDGGWADTRMAEYYCHTRHDPINSTTHLVAGFVLSAN
jgi:site-specific recombinase XerD